MNKEYTTVKVDVTGLTNADMRAKGVRREQFVAWAAESLHCNPNVRFGEAKHRVRKYVQELVETTETSYTKLYPEAKDAQRQRRFVPNGAYKVRKTIGRNPGPVTYETWCTASLGRFTASAPTRELALVQLANLCTP